MQQILLRIPVVVTLGSIVDERQLFDRAAPRLRLVSVRELTLEHPVLLEAADLFGLGH